LVNEDKQEIIETLKQNWAMIVFAIIVFSAIYLFYPYTDMGKRQIQEIDAYNWLNATVYYKLGLLSPEDKAWYMDHLGMTEEDFDPLRRYLEERN